MKICVRLGSVFLLSLLFFFIPAQAKDVVINDGFETQGWQYWEPTGTLPTYEMFVGQFDVTAPNEYSWCFSARTHDGLVGGLIQDVFVQAGVAYTVSADFAYTTC
ncbi:MAG: hypothetical protein KJ645_11455 [Planctomycetes bacterium]|nr:hypothetical protein [Planctomycetota bacterium]